MSTNNTKIEYDRKVQLGQGGFGSVFLGKYNGCKVAVKTVQLHLVNDNEEKALQCLQQLGHPNIVKLFYSERNADFKLFALEFCAASLDQLILNPQNYKEFKLPHHLTVIFHLATGLEYIHSNGLFHRDIKPENVLISFDPNSNKVTMKWADFGLSKFVNERGTCTLSGIKGTANYFAPELLRYQGKSEELGRGTIKSDVFAFALVIGYLLLDGQHLYGSNYGILINIMNKSPVNMDKIDRSHYALDLLKKMLKDEPGERISSTEVVKELETIRIEIAVKEFNSQSQMLTFSMQIEYDKKTLLGKGGCSLVFTGTFNGCKVAVKRVQKLQNVSDNEEKAMQQLDHPNVIKLFHSESNDEFKYFAMELCAASLDQLFLISGHPRKYKGPKLPPHLTVFLQLASGLEHIHSKKLIHRDIKPENVLIFIDFTTGLVTMKWADFGLSKFVNGRGTCTLSGIKGTEYFFAPELLKRLNSGDELGRGDIRSDVFSFALVIGYLLLKGQHVYGSYHNITTNIMNKSPVNMGKIDRSHYARNLLTKMLEDDPNKRISSEEVVRELESAIKIEKEEKFRELLKNKYLDLNQIQFAIQNGIDVNGKDDGGRNALHWLCRFNSSEKIIDAMEFLIQNGIDVKGKENRGKNALHYLCENNESEKLIDGMQFLIKKGIDVNEKTKNGANALHWLCENNESEKLIDGMQFLIKKGIDVKGKDKYGWNALHLLCRFNSSEKLIDAIEFLIQNGIDVNGKDNDGRNALHWLCENNSSKKIIDGMRFLIKNGIDVNGKDNEGWNALRFLCCNTYMGNRDCYKIVDAIRFLIENGIHSVDAHTLLHVKHNHALFIVEIMQLLDRASISN